MGIKKELELDDLSPTVVQIGDDDTDTDSDDEGGGESEEQSTESSSPSEDGRSTQGNQSPKLTNADPSKRTGSRGSPNRPSKGGRWKETMRALNESRARDAERDRQIAELRSTIQQLNQNNQQGAGSQRTPDGKSEEQQIIAQMNELVSLASSESLTTEQRNNLSVRYQALQDQRQELRWQEREAALSEKLRNDLVRQLPASATNPQIAHYNATLNEEFPEVMGNERASQAARQHYEALVTAGRPESIGLLREACAYIASAMGLGAPVNSQRNRSAMSGVAGARTGRGGREVSLSPSDKQVIKQALSSGIDEKYLTRAIAGDRFDS